MKELSIEEKARAYDKALERAQALYNDKNEIGYANAESVLEEVFPLLKESEDELTWLTKYIEEEAYSLSMDIRGNEDRIKLKNLQKALAWLEKQGECHISHDDEIMIEQLTEYFTTGRGLQNTNETVVEWLNDVKEKLEKQGEMDMKSYKAAEDEKREFVGDGFIKCYADFQDFKEGETYWLEYVGNDNYNVRSDNLLDKTYHITPCQLYTIFKKMTWLEKQGEKPQGKSAFEAINEEKVDNANKVEPKFKDGDWVVYEENIYQIHNIGLKKYYECLRTDGTVHIFDFEYIDSKSHLWTLDDAKDGDVLVTPLPKGYEAGEQIFVFKGISSRDYVDDCIEYYCRICQGVYYENETGYMGTTSETFYPATKKQRDLLFQKMHEAGYEWDAEKKETKLLITNGGDFESENCKQKFSWSEEDDDDAWMNDIISKVENNLQLNKAEIDWLKSLRPQLKQKWSEEDA